MSIKSSDCTEQTFLNLKKLRTTEMKKRLEIMFNNYLKGVMCLLYENKDQWRKVNEIEFYNKYNPILNEFACKFSMNLKDNIAIDSILSDDLKRMEYNYSEDIKYVSNIKEIINEFGFNEEKIQELAVKINNNLFEFLIEQRLNVKKGNSGRFKKTFNNFKKNHFNILNEEIFNKRNITIKSLINNSKRSFKNVNELCMDIVFIDKNITKKPELVDSIDAPQHERLNFNQNCDCINLNFTLGCVSIITFFSLLLFFIIKRRNKSYVS